MKVVIYAHTERDLDEINAYLSSETYGHAYKGTGILLEPYYNAGKGIQEAPTEAIVAPGNSYGIMTGGFDMGLVEAFGEDLAEDVQETINRYHGGELNVGDCVVVPIGWSGPMRVLFYAPTMRVPKSIHHHTDIPYMATRAALMKAKTYYDRDNFSILVPLMCRGTGGVPTNIILHQVQLAAGQVMGHENLYVPSLEKGRIIDQLIHGKSRFAH